MGDIWTTESLKVMSQAGGGGHNECLGVKEGPCRGYVEIDHVICLILHIQINLGNTTFHNLLDYGNKYIEKLSVDEDISLNSLLAIDSSIHEKINLRE